MSDSKEEYIGPYAERKKDVGVIASELGAMSLAELRAEAIDSIAEGDYQGGPSQIAALHYARATALLNLAQLKLAEGNGPGEA